MAAPKILSGIMRDEVALAVLEKRGVHEALSNEGLVWREEQAYVILVCFLKYGNTILSL
jgi:uncharacterized protein (DUF302 family)